MSEDLTARVLAHCLAEFPHLRLTVTGSCMRPALRAGQAVHVRSSARRPPRWGDVVLVRHSDGLRLHRLVWGPPVASATGWWRTKADRAPAFDARVRAGDVLGTVVEVEGRGTPRRLAATARSLLSAVASCVRSALRRP